MNSLEWVDKQILLVKENIQYHKDLLAESEEEYTDEIISAIKLLEPELQTLQQIKDILEAWYAVEKHLEYFPSDFWNGISEDVIAMTSPIDKEDYPIIKKAKGLGGKTCINQ